MVLRVLDRVVGVVAITVIATTAFITCLGVFFRYVMNAALPWPEEVAGYLLVWITFGGGYIAARQGQHISFDLFVNALPAPLAGTIQAVVDVCLTAFFAFLFVISVYMVSNFGGTLLASVEIPEMVFMIAIPIFAGGTFLHMAVNLIRRWWRR